jgi:DNA-binding FadR family transcriptional regulator
MPTRTTDRVSRITREIEHAILSGTLAEGEFLPAERRLSEQYGVSRSVVREALGRLVSLGLIECRHRAGSRVAAPNGRGMSVVYERLLHNSRGGPADLAVVRMALETTSAALAAANRSDAHLSRLARAQRALGNPQTSLAAHVSADARFHGILAEATGNRFFPLVLAPMHDLLMKIWYQAVRKFGGDIALVAQDAHNHHERILDAVRRRDSAAAGAAMREHLLVNIRTLQDIARRRADASSAALFENAPRRKSKRKSARPRS